MITVVVLRMCSAAPTDSGAPYYLLASTNVALSRAQWQVMATNYFDSSGKFIFTNNSATNLQMFYMLQLP